MNMKYKQWVVAPSRPEDRAALERSGLPSVLSAILSARGIRTPEQARALLSGAEDPIGNYGAGVDAVMDSYDEVGMLDVSSILYEGARHEILNEEVGVQVMEDIHEWILDHIPEALA